MNTHTTTPSLPTPVSNVSNVDPSAVPAAPSDLSSRDLCTPPPSSLQLPATPAARLSSNVSSPPPPPLSSPKQPQSHFSRTSASDYANLLSSITHDISSDFPKPSATASGQVEPGSTASAQNPNPNLAVSPNLAVTPNFLLEIPSSRGGALPGRAPPPHAQSSAQSSPGVTFSSADYRPHGGVFIPNFVRPVAAKRQEVSSVWRVSCAVLLVAGARSNAHTAPTLSLMSPRPAPPCPKAPLW